MRLLWRQGQGCGGLPTTGGLRLAPVLAASSCAVRAPGFPFAGRYHPLNENGRWRLASPGQAVTVTGMPTASAHFARTAARQVKTSLVAALAVLLAVGVAAVAAPAPSSAAVVPPRAVASYAPPGVGAYWRAALKGHNQVVVADGVSNGTTNVRVTLWTYVGANKWRNDGSYAGNGGRGGWGKTRQGDLRSPVGVFSLTDAGGYYPNPGTRLPYQYSPRSYSTVVEGVREFSYVVAIGYNHVVGTPPSSTRTPGPYSRGNQIWLHERHLHGTEGCIGIPRAGMVRTLRWLNPATHPVILMAPHSTIVRAR